MPGHTARIACALTIFALSGPALAREPIDTSAYPELSPTALAPAVLASLKHTLKDPHSIQDFTICRPYKLGLKDGRPHTWATMLSFNARNGMGGYEGVTMYAAAFKDGAISGDVTKAEMNNNEGLNRIINKAIAKDMIGCQSIPDAEVQRLLNN